MSFDTTEVDNLRKVYNKENPKENSIRAGDIGSVWKELKKRFHKKCKTGKPECIISSMLTKTPAPGSWKANPEEWLSTDEIDNLEKQFMVLFSNYYYVGSFPIDFDAKSETGKCLVSALCSMNIQDLYSKGYTQIGIVFNTDVSSGPGEHWISLFCDIGPELEFPRITYFDSYAQSPEKEIQILMKRWKQQWDSTGVHKKPMQMTYNKTRHQFQNSECGMYSLYFHFCCLMNMSMEERIPDDVVRGFRGMLFHVGKK